MKDYKVDIKVRNNRIIKAIEESGGKLGQKWCEENGLNYPIINKLVNLQQSPLKKNKVDLIDTAYKLCEVLNKSPNELWTDEQINPLQTNKISIELKTDQVKQLVNYEETDPTELLALTEMKDTMHRLIGTLPRVQQYILKMRFFDSMTLEEVGKELNLSRERVRNIEQKALRMLRYPARGKYLKDFV